MSHFKEVCKHGVVMKQCRCPGPKTERLVDCDHADKPDITDLLRAPALREELRTSLFQAGHAPETVENLLTDLEDFVEQQVAKIKAERGRGQA